MICMKCIYRHIYSFITVDVVHLVIRLSDVKKSSVGFLFCFLKSVSASICTMATHWQQQPLLSSGVLTRTPFVYLFLSSSNILLDSHMTAKLSDFGLARFVPTGTSAASTTSVGKTTTVRGTLAYLPEEYVRGGELGPKLDVYSFGVVRCRRASWETKSVSLRGTFSAVWEDSVYSYIPNYKSISAFPITVCSLVQKQARFYYENSGKLCETCMFLIL